MLTFVELLIQTTFSSENSRPQFEIFKQILNNFANMSNTKITQIWTFLCDSKLCFSNWIQHQNHEM